MNDKDLVMAIVKDFTKDEIMSMLIELEIQVDDDIDANSRTLTVKLLTDLDANGIPEDLQAISDTMYEFLVASGFIDEEGNELDRKGDQTNQKDNSQKGDDVTIPSNSDTILPPCYGMADDLKNDPACKKCIIYDDCLARRINMRPQCYGKYYNKSADECKVCLENFNCQKGA